MTYWQENLDLGSVLKKDHPGNHKGHEECPRETKEQIALEIEKSQWLKKFANDVRECVTYSDLTALLDDVYEEADFRHVWLNLE